jgi:hypothetical protein
MDVEDRYTECKESDSPPACLQSQKGHARHFTQDICMVEDFQDGQDCRSVNLSEALVDDDSPKER